MAVFPVVDYFPSSPLIPVRVLPTNGHALCVTSLDDEVFVVRWKGQRVEVYDAETMTQKRILEIPGLGDGECNLAACGVNKCVYVADSSNDVVHRVQLTGESTVTKWSAGDSPEGLSVNSSHNVLVTNFSATSLQEYTTNGQLVRKIPLPPVINCLMHSVQLSATQFGVTHHIPFSGYSVIEDGKIMTTYDTGSGPGYGQMDYPYGVALNKHGFVFIADKNNNRIVILNPDSFTSRVLPVSVGGELRGPISLSIDEPRDRLYIGEREGGRLLVVSGVSNLRFA